MFNTTTVDGLTITLLKHRDQIRRRLQKRLVRIRTQGRERVQPVLRCFVRIKRLLFLFSSRTNLAFNIRTLDHSKIPGLSISAARRSAGCQQTLLNNFTGHRPIGKLPNTPASLCGLKKISRPLAHLILVQDRKMEFKHGRCGFHPSSLADWPHAKSPSQTKSRSRRPPHRSQQSGLSDPSSDSLESHGNLARWQPVKSAL